MRKNRFRFQIVNGSCLDDKDVTRRFKGSGIQGRIIKKHTETDLRICHLWRIVRSRSGRTLKLENSESDESRVQAWIPWIRLAVLVPANADNDARVFNRDNRHNLQIRGRCVVPTAGRHFRRHSRLLFLLLRYRYLFLFELQSLCLPFALLSKVIVI